VSRKHRAKPAAPVAPPPVKDVDATVTVTVVGAEIHGPLLPSGERRVFAPGVQQVPLRYFERAIDAGYGKALDYFVKQGRLVLGEVPAPPAPPVAPPALAGPSLEDKLLWISHETDAAFLDGLARDVLTPSAVSKAAFDRLKQLDEKV
jgi:hypothetical protein